MLIIIVYLVGVLITIVISTLIAHTAHKSQAARKKFSEQTNGLPLIGKAHWLYNHALYPVKKDNNQDALKMHRELGDTVGWLYRQQFAVSCVDLDLIKVLNQDEAQVHVNKLRREQPIREWRRSITSIEDDEWRRVRHAIVPAFKSTRFKTPLVTDQIQTTIDKLLEHIERKTSVGGGSSELFNLDSVIHRYSIDLILRCFYGQDNSDGGDVINYGDPYCQWTSRMNSLFDGIQSSRFYKLGIIFPILIPLIDWLAWNFHWTGRWRREFVKLVDDHTKRRLIMRRHQQQSPNPGQQSLGSVNKLLVKINQEQQQQQQPQQQTPFKSQIFDHVIDQYCKGNLTRDQYISNACFLLPAADKTSSDTLVHTLYLLATNAQVQARLRESISYEGCESEYLGWVIKESLRLRPPISTGCSRLTKRDLKTKEGYVLPAGTAIQTPAFVIHRLEKYWGTDANEFRPERWANTAGHHPFQYIPFGGGARVCPGRDFALFQIKLLLTQLLLRYSFTCQAKPDMYHYDAPFGTTIIPYSPVQVTITRLGADAAAGGGGGGGAQGA